MKAWLPAFIRESSLSLVKHTRDTASQKTLLDVWPGRRLGVWIFTLPHIGPHRGRHQAKPGVVDGRIEIRQVLDLTISFDHDIVDGADAARFANTLKGLIEQAAGLDEEC